MNSFKLPDNVHWGRDFQQASAKGNFFNSVKTPNAIEFRRRWHLDGLRTLSLDPEVKSIHAYSGTVTPPEDAETPLLIRMKTGSIVVAFGREPANTFLLGNNVFKLFTRNEIEAEPRWTTIKEIWSTRNTPIDPADRVRLLKATGASHSGLPLAELCDLVRWPDVEPVHAILALVLENELELNCNERLAPETLVRRVAQKTVSHEPAKSCFETETKSLELNCKPPALAKNVHEVPICRTRSAINKGRPKLRDYRQTELLLPIECSANRDGNNANIIADSTASPEFVRHSFTKSNT